MSLYLDELKDKLLQPISDAQPCGEDPKYEDAYDQLKQEIAKMGGMGIGSTDWEKVELLAIGLLETRSKELNLCAFLVAAWTARYQFEGMVVGMELVSSMVSRFWEGMFPPVSKIKPRRGAFSWLQDRLSTELDGCKSEDRQLLTRGIQAVSDLKDAVYDHFEDPPCNFRKIRDTLEGWLEQLPEPVAELPSAEPAPAVPANAPIQQVSAAGAATAPPPQPSSPVPAAGAAPVPAAAPKRSNVPVEIPNLADDADAGKLLEHLAKIANQLRGLAANSETAYLMLRKALWEAVGEPRSDHSGETFFPAPAEELLNAMTTMFKRAAWQELLERAEDLTNRWWYWLDLQYFAAEAASGLGWDAVAECIKDQTHNLDLRLPRLKELKFNDGTPFANSTTRDWLARLTRRDAANGASATSAEEPGEALLSQLRAKGSEAFPEAMKLAQQAIETAMDRRTALGLKAAAASFCLEVEQPEWAARLLESLILEMESQNFGWWEPRKVGEIWRLMYEAARKLAEDDDYYRPWVRRAMNGMASFDLNQVGRFPKKESR